MTVTDIKSVKENQNEIASSIVFGRNAIVCYYPGDFHSNRGFRVKEILPLQRKDFGSPVTAILASYIHQDETYSKA